MLHRGAKSGKKKKKRGKAWALRVFAWMDRFWDGYIWVRSRATNGVRNIL